MNRCSSFGPIGDLCILDLFSVLCLRLLVKDFACQFLSSCRFSSLPPATKTRSTMAARVQFLPYVQENQINAICGMNCFRCHEKLDSWKIAPLTFESLVSLLQMLKQTFCCLNTYSDTFRLIKALLAIPGHWSIHTTRDMNRKFSTGHPPSCHTAWHSKS